MIPDIYPHTRPKAILFDWDNTLVDTWQTVFQALNTAREAVDQLPFTVEEFFERPHLSIRDTALELFGDHFEKGEQVFYEAIGKTHLETLKVLEGAGALLDQLKGLGIYMGIVSNKDGHHLRKEVHHLGWNAHFHQIIGARDTAEDKPSPIPVLAALKNSQTVPSHDVWFVGDSIVDVHCARASGCVPIVVGHGQAARQEDIVHAQDCHGLAQLIARL
jgi:phosphoglycolate phosphatase